MLRLGNSLRWRQIFSGETSFCIFPVSPINTFAYAQTEKKKKWLTNRRVRELGKYEKTTASSRENGDPKSIAGEIRKRANTLRHRDRDEKWRPTGQRKSVARFHFGGFISRISPPVRADSTSCWWFLLLALAVHLSADGCLYVSSILFYFSLFWEVPRPFAMPGNRVRCVLHRWHSQSLEPGEAPLPSVSHLLLHYCYFFASCLRGFSRSSFPYDRVSSCICFYFPFP